MKTENWRPMWEAPKVIRPRTILCNGPLFVRPQRMSWHQPANKQFPGFWYGVSSKEQRTPHSRVPDQWLEGSEQ